MGKDVTGDAVRKMRESNAAQDRGDQAKADRLWEEANKAIDSTGRNVPPRR